MTAKSKSILLVLGGPLGPDSAPAQALSRAGYRVSELDSPSGLLQAIEERLPDLVIIPDRLGKERPFDLAAKVRYNHPDLAMILVGKSTTGELLLKGMHNGFVDVLSLPVEDTRLFESVERALAHRQGWERWLHKETGRLTGSLKQQLNELETILKQVDDGVLVLDRSGRLMMANRAVREAFGLAGREIVGLKPEELFDNGELVSALSNDDSASSTHVEIETPDGRCYNLRQTQIPEIGTIASLHDISYLKELDRLKGDFVNTVSHDLRSPLTAILGYVELIERAGDVNKQQAEFIRRVKTSVHATTDLINDLLNLGRLEVGMVKDMQPLQLQVIVGEAVEAVMARVEQKEQTLRMAVDGKVSKVTGSPVQLRQVVDNLIGNAVKYTPRGGEIRVMLREEDGQVILHVADNGPGIPAEDQGQIFDKFYRASNVGKDVQGTGLGLAIVKTVVDHHHGRIWVDSRPGQASIFTVVLPVS